jgi:hypothetical protein
MELINIYCGAKNIDSGITCMIYLKYKEWFLK